MAQSCLTFCYSMDCSLPGSSVYGIFQVRILEWVAISFSSDQVWSEMSEVKSLSRVQLFVTPWTVVYQAPLFMGFSRQKYWSGLPFPSPKNLRVQLFVTPWTVVYRAPLFMGFSRQKYWSGLPFLSPKNLFSTFTWTLSFSLNEFLYLLKNFCCYLLLTISLRAFQVALVVKNPPVNAGIGRDAVRSLDREDTLE